jgi:type VI secretion system protein ImpM
MDAQLPQCVGWYGKLPSRGDFVSRGLPRDWLRTWDEWLLRALAPALHGAPLRDRLLTVPPWQCVILPAQAGQPAWCGVVAASTDRVGRAFPFLLVEAYDAAALLACELSTLRLRGQALIGWLDEAIAHATPKEFEAGAADLAATPWSHTESDATDATERLADWCKRWPSAVSFWWRIDGGADGDAPLAEPWPPRESLVLAWLGEPSAAPLQPD